MSKWKIIILVLLGLLLVSAAACNPLGSSESTVTEIQSVKVERGDITFSVTGSGNIEASREARLTFGSTGKVERLYVEKGNKVAKGDVLARLDTSPLELSLAQAQVAVVQAQLAVTQAQLAEQTAEHDLKNIRDSRDALELVLFNAQISVDQATYNLEQVQDLNTWSDIKVAQSDVDEAESYLKYALEQLYKYIPPNEDGTYPTIDEDFSKLPGYKKWEDTVIHAQARLNAAKDALKAMQSGRDTEETAIKRKQVEAAEMAKTQAEKDLEDLDDDIAIKELQLEAARQSTEEARQSAALAEKSKGEAQKNLDEATIVAPFSAVVADTYVKEGDMVPNPTVSPKTVVYLIDLTSMELIVDLDEIDIPGIQAGQKAIITLDALPDVELQGQVSSVYPLPTSDGGVVIYHVKTSFSTAEEYGLRPGMSASADIIISSKSNVLLVPSRAISKDSEGNSIVKVVTGGQTQDRQVVTGISNDLQTEIISGLSEGETVLVETQVAPKSSTTSFF